jgi:hypothetical protein
MHHRLGDNRKHMFRTFKNCFYGDEALRWLSASIRQERPRAGATTTRASQAHVHASSAPTLANTSSVPASAPLPTSPAAAAAAAAASVVANSLVVTPQFRDEAEEEPLLERNWEEDSFGTVSSDTTSEAEDHNPSSSSSTSSTSVSISSSPATNISTNAAANAAAAQTHTPPSTFNSLFQSQPLTSPRRHAMLSSSAPIVGNSALSLSCPSVPINVDGADEESATTPSASSSVAVAAATIAIVAANQTPRSPRGDVQERSQPSNSGKKKHRKSLRRAENALEQVQAGTTSSDNR